MRKKVIEIDQSVKCFKAISKALGLHSDHSESHYPQMVKTWTGGETSQEWPDFQNYPKRAGMTHPRGLKDPTTTAKDLQTSLALVKVSVHDSNIRKSE